MLKHLFELNASITPTLSSCNGLLSNCIALYLASELWAPLSRYKGERDSGGAPRFTKGWTGRDRARKWGAGGEPGDGPGQDRTGS
jgi:hypothetical protein